MVRKTKQWVPVDGTRWRSEVANGRENRRVGAHYDVAHRGVMAPLRELPTIGGLWGSRGRPCGGPGFILHEILDGDAL